MIYLLLTIANSYETQEIRIAQTCSTGLTGYFWNGQQCIKCKQPSCKCSTYNGCTSCLNSYYYDATDSTCTPCPLGCLKCCKSSSMTQYVCTLCDNAYLMISGVCIYANACNQLTIHGRCQSCMDSYYLEQECYECPIGCSSCDSQYYCTACEDGYYLDVIGNALLCVSCNTDTTSGCSYCGDVLDEDSGSIIFICQVCMSNYYYDEDQYTCTACTDHCKSCQNPAIEPQVCYTCETGYLLSSDASLCQSCQEQINYCMTCTLSDDSTSWVCSACYNGFYLQNNKCIYCYSETNNVRYCDSPTEITQCIPGYLLLQDESNTLKCVKDQYNCYTIDTSEQCYNCYTGQYLVFDQSLQKQICKKCTSIDNCEECDVSNYQMYCKTCSSGYYTNNSNCVKCTENCSQCQSISTCQTCLNGYFLDSSLNCSSCEVDNCIICSAAKECTLCADNYGLVNSVCEQCLTGCQNCDDNADECNVCGDRYYLVAADKTCKRYKENCLKSNINGYCYLCNTTIDFNPSTEIFPDEYSDESTPYYEVQPAVFYISNNGYCLTCADYATGTYQCPQVCTIEQQYSVQLIVLIIFYLI